ncbi:MAG: hypothetical protein LBG64_04005 [Pseudomonadales bacterium]|jgi:hypothetical protein|nr:hypothetical protein [Pseudomonadales bacterium]
MEAFLIYLSAFDEYFMPGASESLLEEMKAKKAIQFVAFSFCSASKRFAVNVVVEGGEAIIIERLP